MAKIRVSTSAGWISTPPTLNGACWKLGKFSGAVTPLKPRGSGDARVRLLYARHGTPEGDAVALAQAKHKAVILPPDHPLAEQAYAKQVKRERD